MIKIYTTGYVILQNAPFDLNIKVVDSCFEFNFNTHTWSNLGATNPELIEMLNKDNYYTYQMDSLLIMRHFLICIG